MMKTEISASPSIRRRRNRNAIAFPITAPTPNEANSQPAILGSWPKRAITSTGIVMKNAVQAASPIAKTGHQTRSRGSRSRKRSPLRILLERRATRHERGDEEDGDDIAAGIQNQDARRSHHADQDPAERRPEQQRRPRSRLEEGVRLSHLRLVLTEQLGDDHLLRREIGSAERTEPEGDGKQHGEREPSRPVEHRDDEHERGTRSVADDHRPARAEPAEETTAGQPEQGEPDELGRHHEARLRGRPGGDEDEPRQSEPGHLRAGRGDDLGAEQRQERRLPEEVLAAHARCSSRRPGIGEKSRNKTPAEEPATLIHIVSRRPIAPPSTPPSSAPTGRVP